MGRTKRIRARLKKREKYSNPGLTDEIIPLMKWMGDLNWKNTSRIICRFFEGTGRGVTARQNLYHNDVLITAPFKLLITYSTLSNSEDFMRIFIEDATLGIHDVLAAFLVLERHKKDKSFWRYYLETLPIREPTLPWFASKEEIENFPCELKTECMRCRSNFEESFERLKNSIKTSLECTCCVEKIQDILNWDSFKWGYTMVNTRGVYIDPVVVEKLSKHNIIHDAPQLAMFPLMDMFNHSDVAENKIEFKESSGELFYQLSTLNSYKKHSQIFISYGRHDNTKLFVEYGFYLPFNSNDKIKFSPSEIIQCLKLKLNNFQFQFLKSHKFLDTQELFISVVGPSFKMKGFLFVALNGEEKNYSSCVFSGVFNGNFLKLLKNCILQLLDRKIEEFDSDLSKFRDESKENEVICNFLQNRIECVVNIKKEINRFE